MDPLHSHCLMIHLNSFVATGKTKDAIIHLNFDTRLPAKTRFASGYEVNRYSRLRVESENVKELQPSKNTFYPQFKDATARYYASHTKTMLPTRKSMPRSSRQSDHTKTSLTTAKRHKLQWYSLVSRSSGLAKTILQDTVKNGRRQGRQRKR